MDLLRGFVHRASWVDGEFGPVRSEHVADVAAFALPLDTGGEVLGTRNHVAWLDESAEPLECEVPIPPGHRFNDGAVDANGRVVAGTMAEDGSREAGLLWSLSPGEAPTTLLRGLNLPNGIAFSRTCDRLYLIESVPGLLYEFRYDLDSGTVAECLSQWPIARGAALPDGMAMDESGCLWIAMWDGSCVVKFDPIAGAVVDCVDVPARRPTSVAIADDDRTLFVTTATYGLDAPCADIDGAVLALTLSP